MPKEGQVWPLQLVVCLLLLVLGLLTFIDPTLFGQNAPISQEASLLRLGGAILTGIVLYSSLLTRSGSATSRPSWPRWPPGPRN
jgi:hypothetical protein